MMSSDRCDMFTITYNINKYISPDCTNKIFTAQLHDVWELKVLLAISEYIGMTSPVMTLCPKFGVNN